MSINANKLITSALIWFVVLCSSAAVAQTLPLPLLGIAEKKVLSFKVVTVRLYVLPGHKGDRVLRANIPKRLEVTYHVNIPKEELQRATTKGIKKNVPSQTFDYLKPKIDQINSYYPDVKSGDQVVITYEPNTGCQIKINGQIKGTVTGNDFAWAFFSIWIGDKPVDYLAKQKLLGQRRGP